MNILLLLLTLLVVLLYASMLWYYHPSTFVEKERIAPTFPFVSILVPARNEAQLLGECLAALVHQNYPADRYEIIVIDDHSTDDTADIVRAFAQKESRIKLLSLKNKLAGREVVAYKKAALTHGIEKAKGSILLTTDADCVPGPAWVVAMTACTYDLRLGPVRMAFVRDLITAFQALDLCGVMQLTAGSAQRGQAMLANGANLGFSKKIFNDIGGYTGVDHLASGDDVLLLQKIRRESTASIGFIDRQEAVVSTQPLTSWRALWQQRLRWAGKTGAYTDYRLIGVQGISFALCWAAILSIVLPFVSHYISFWPALLLWSGKMLIDFFWLRAACQRFGEGQWMRWFVPAFFLHTLYVAVIGLAALLPIRNSWKDRGI